MVIDPSKHLNRSVAVIFAFFRRELACACHTSAVPWRAFDRTTSDHFRPPPASFVTRCVVRAGPLAATNASTRSLASLVVTAGDVSFPVLPLTLAETTLSVAAGLAVPGTVADCSSLPALNVCCVPPATCVISPAGS